LNNIPLDLPLVIADPIRVERILYNLVDNAIKYSPMGGEVIVSASNIGDYLEISVKDQGMGISPNDQARLFQSFERLGVQVNGAIQGTGLGLRVCFILVEALGGKIWVESEPGKGSTFYFTLPVIKG
jgi:signal transduction histidine kinase